MAISVYEKLGQKITPKSSCSKSSNLNSYLMKLEYAADGSTVSIKNDPTNKLISPYLSGDKIQLHSRVTERKLIRKKTDFVSSFPLAVNIYKASSDEFKLCKQGNKKVKKSVLTLPNEPAPVPQMCTVSDMTESEYFNESKEERKPKTRKKRTLQNNRKLRKNKTVDIYDRDAHYCSQLDIDLDSSSTDFINRFPGDGKKQPRRKVKKTDVKPHDVWEMLRNINQFHFVPSAPISQDSIVSLKKKPNLIKTRNSCRDARVIETCRTEQFAYISNFVDNSHSQSSLDRVTVIDKQENYQKICKEIEKGVENCKSKFCRANQKKNKPKATRKQNFKAITNNVNNTEISKRHVNETPSSDIYNNINEQKNEKSGLKIYTTDNKEDDKFSNCIDSSQTNLIRRVDFNKQQEQEDNKLRKKIKPQMTGITKVVVSKGNNAFQKSDEEQNPDVITITTTPPILKPLEIEKPSSIVTEGSLPRSKQGKLNHGNLKVVYVGDIKINKGKANNNAAMHKSKANNKPNVLEKDVIEADTEMKHKRQLKDKMIQLLYKKHQDDITDESKDKNAKKVERYLVEIGTNTLVDFDSFKEPNVTKDVVEFAKPSPLKRSWAKGKWASDFIDSVIRKIRSGVYYSNEEKQPIKSKYSKREDSSQTSINHSNSMEPRFLNRDEDRLVPNHIPFKRPQPDVKSFNRTKIEKTGSVSNSVNELNFAVRERLKNVNFEDFDNTTQINFPKIGEHRNLLKQSDLAKTLPTVKHSWVDGKWASDFIDNIFKKIKSGVYYTHEEKSEYRTYQNTRDDLTQTESDTPQLNVSQCQETADENVITETTIETTSCESFTPLPGFDEPNELEIETYSQKQIVVKNCVTNVVVKFDVELPCDSYQSLQVKQSLSCIPVVTDTQTKVFKSKTTIINAYLPAELCSILPIIMRKIIVPNKFSLPKLTVGKVESSLSTISELTRCESLEFPNQTPCKICEPRTDLLLNMKSIKIFDCKAKSTALLELKIHEPDVGREDCPTLQKRIICMALQLYQPLNQIVPAYKRFNLLFYIENLIYNKVLTKIMNTPVIINSIDIRCFNNSMAISMGLGVGISRVNIFISNISNHSECNPKNCIESPQNIGVPDSKPIIVPKVLDIYTNKSESHATHKKKSKSELRSYNNKTKKRGFVKLYKKCKSMSNLSNYNSSISIDKITNFEEFFQTLGLPKMFSTVIDGDTERKIMSSLKEMKNWKADITSRQAFLVLLLANKKDTCNVLRYRPLILQGIAVNRITKASELDMEIEVIERENLNRLSQYEGISYLPASVENQDALLEELYWIAKTTASDYQRPFDESSERLLKSLLEKRKKLNPSYLRVMARYVGLGLLKTSK